MYNGINPLSELNKTLGHLINLRIQYRDEIMKPEVLNKLILDISKDVQRIVNKLYADEVVKTK